MQMTPMNRIRVAATRGAIFLLCLHKVIYYQGTLRAVRRPRGIR